MSGIAAIEDAIIGKLREALPGMAVEPFPQRPQEYELLHPEGAVLVQYDGSRLADAGVTGAAAALRIVTFTVCALTRNLRDSAGSYSVLESISRALTGFRPQGVREGGKLVAERFLFESNGVWAYVQSYEYRMREVFSDHN